MQKAYGKSKAEIETLVEGFAWALSGVDTREVSAAMREYVLNNSDIPAPANILKIVKHNRDVARIGTADIEQIKRYRDRGITLTPAQQSQLDEYESQ